MIKLSQNMRFSYNISRGSMSSRKKLADELNVKIFERMVQLYDRKNTCGLGAVKSRYNSTLPERKDIEINPIRIKKDDDLSGSTSISENGRNILSGYSIELPANKKKKLSISDLSQLMHESTHVLDYLLNPKYAANYFHMCEKNIFNKKYFNLYEKYFYNTEDMMNGKKKEMLILAEEETRKGLRGVPKEEKIIFLNYIKYCMEMEYHAYSQDIKYTKLLQKLGKPIVKEDLEDFNKFLAFPEKITLVNQLIMEELRSAGEK